MLETPFISTFIVPNLNIIHQLVFRSIFLEKFTCFKYFFCVVGKLAVYGMTPFFMLTLFTSNDNELIV